jgi:hypothetical protein
VHQFSSKSDNNNRLQAFVYFQDDGSGKLGKWLHASAFYVFGKKATLCVSPIAIVDDGHRRRDKMYNAQYLANDITFLPQFSQPPCG